MSFITGWEISGIIATAIVALITYLRTKDNVKSQPTLMVALLGLLLTLLVSLRFNVLPQIAQRQPDPDAFSLLVDFTEAQRYVESNGDLFFTNNFAQRSREFRKVLDAARQGRYIVDKHEIGTFSYDLVSSARQKVIATSKVKSDEWWDTPWGKRYEELNYRLVDKNVVIQRYFIIDSRKSFPAIRDLVKRQCDRGIEVFIVFAHDVDYRHEYDVIVIDDRVAGKLKLTSDQGIVEAVMYTSRADIDDTRRILEALNAAAVNAKDLVGSVAP